MFSASFTQLTCDAVQIPISLHIDQGYGCYCSVQLRDTQPPLLVVVPACLREHRNSDGTSVRKGFMEREGQRTGNTFQCQTSLLMFGIRSAVRLRFWQERGFHQSTVKENWAQEQSPLVGYNWQQDSHHQGTKKTRSQRAGTREGTLMERKQAPLFPCPDPQRTDGSLQLNGWLLKLQADIQGVAHSLKLVYTNLCCKAST